MKEYVRRRKPVTMQLIRNPPLSPWKNLHGSVYVYSVFCYEKPKGASDNGQKRCVCNGFD